MCWVPPYRSSAGAEAVELAALAGLYLDDWQQYVLTESLGEQRDGTWAALEVGLVVARQNGKGGLLEARELAGLFLLGERLIIHSAHLFDTSLEAFRRLLALIEQTPDLERRVKRVSRSHGEEGIELKNRQRIRFRTRTKGGGRGLTGDCVILDEAMVLSQAAHGALMPTLSARPNPQIWYTGSAVDEDVHEHGVVLAKIRERGIAGGDPRLAYFEWSADPAIPPESPEAWAQSNPALGIRIPEGYVAVEQRSMHSRTFEVERLSLGHWPKTDEDGDRIIPADVWAAGADPDSQITGAPVFAVDVTPDRAKASISVAGARADGSWHVEVVDNGRGTGWVVDRCVALSNRHGSPVFVVDPRSPAGTLIAPLKEAGVNVVEIDTQGYARACGRLFDLASQRRLKYPDPQPELDSALKGAAARPLGEAWAWARRSSTDISPLVAVTLALWGAENAAKRAEPHVWDLEQLLAEDDEEEVAA